MDRPRCSMTGCQNEDSHSMVGGNRRFHVFPTNFNMCMLWVQNSGRPEFFEDFAFAGSQSFINRYICSDHFSDSDFIDPKDRLSGLLPTAVPNLNFSLPKAGLKEEYRDGEYVESLDGTLISDSEIVNEPKVEKLESDNGANFSFSSADDSCNDILSGNLCNNVNEYKETEQDKRLSEEFFRNYSTAILHTRLSSSNRAYQTEEDRADRLKREALRAKIRRLMETEEEARVRRMKNALRAAFRRQNETLEQREARKTKDMLRAQRRRKSETENEANIRRQNDAIRAAFRRNNETKNQRNERKMKDIERAAKRRRKETPEERETRLSKDRERASRRRTYKKMVEEIVDLSTRTEYAHLLIPIKLEPENGVRRVAMTSLQSVAAECDDPDQEPTYEKLRQVLDFVHGKTNKVTRRSARQKKTNNKDTGYDVKVIGYDGLECLKEGADSNRTPCAVNSEDSESFGEDCASEELTDVTCHDGHDMEAIVDFLQPEVIWG